MNAVAFDTLKTTRALENSGIPRAQAEAIAEQMAESRSIDLSHLATREELQAEIASVRSEIASVRSDLTGVKNDLKHEIALLDQRVTLAEHRITIKLGGMLVVITGILLAAIRYLSPTH